MKLIIDIPDNMDLTNVPYDILNIITDGVPLPKHHGRIIDADDIALIDEQFYVLSDYYVVESAIDNASTIIKAE